MSERMRYSTIVADPPWPYDMVERYSPGPWLEVFSRRARLGWQTWGDQALHGT